MIVTPPVLLLHGDGWDELIMIAVGLFLAFVVISFTGRRQDAEATDETSADERPGGTTGEALDEPTGRP